MSNNLFIGVQADLRPIAPSLKNYLAKQPPFDRCIVRAPLGLDMSASRPLQFDDVLKKNGSHLAGPLLGSVCMFIGAPDLVPQPDWHKITQVIDAWDTFFGIKALCFEAMEHWNAQFQFAYACCKIAGIKVMVEGIPTPEIPLDVEILLQSQRYVNNYRRGNLTRNYKYNVIVRRDALQYAGVFKGLFGTAPNTLDELQAKIESTGAEVFRYPTKGKVGEDVD